MLTYLDGNQLIDQNAIHENLLNNSVGPFPADLGKNINYGIYDKSTVSLIKGKTYTISCKSNGNLFGKAFDATANTSSFSVYFYTPDHSNYFQVLGNSKGNSLTFTMKNFSGIWVLCMQYNGNPTNDGNKFPKVEQVKVEQGNKATSWLPSSQDLADVISKMVTGEK
ncbi:hypothetical protein AAA413_05320 [Lactobacillus crispatus]|uniref:hypothetical protein n=1 Tax=Lactobacillus crispatus TaxID=47770 RepID=UPI0030F80B40